MAPEVLMYIQKLKQHFSISEIRQKYFYPDGNKNEFFDKVEKISDENFKKNGDPALTPDQFEIVRNETNKITPLFIVVRVFGEHYGYYSLN